MQAILVGLVTLSVLSILVVLSALRGPSSVSPFDESTQSALEQYALVVRNMSKRMTVAEQALLRLQARRHREASGLSAEKRTSDSKAEEEDDGGSAASPRGTEDGGEETPEETEEQRIAFQHTLIGYDELTKQFKQRWRKSDLRCGVAVPPLPDGTPVECSPGSEAPCCSWSGWCGKSADHCLCGKGCVDHSLKVVMEVEGIELLSEGRECEEEAASLGAITTSEECASKVLKRAECGREFTFRAPTSTLHYLSAALSLFSSSYPSWGCRCCSSNSGPSDEAHPDWSVYRLQARIVS